MGNYIGEERKAYTEIERRLAPALHYLKDDETLYDVTPSSTGCGITR